jgi:hypothetical protein
MNMHQIQGMYQVAGNALNVPSPLTTEARYNGGTNR